MVFLGVTRWGGPAFRSPVLLVLLHASSGVRYQILGSGSGRSGSGRRLLNLSGYSRHFKGMHTKHTFSKSTKHNHSVAIDFSCTYTWRSCTPTSSTQSSRYDDGLHYGGLRSSLD